MKTKNADITMSPFPHLIALRRLGGDSEPANPGKAVNSNMPNFIPDAQRLSEIFSNAIAPTFFIGAVAAFVSLMTSRASAVIERIRTLNSIGDEDQARVRLKGDLERLRRRARLLNSGILAALRGGVSATLLLALMFIAGFAGLKHVYGAGLLFIIATGFLGFALIRFAQEARISLHEYDEYE